MRKQPGMKKVKRRISRNRTRRKKGRIWGLIGILLFIVLIVSIGIILFAWMQKREEDIYIDETEVAEIADVISSDESMKDVYFKEDTNEVEENQAAAENNYELWMATAHDVNEMINDQMEMITEFKEESQISISIMGDSISTFKGFIPDGYYDFFPDNGAVQDVNETWWKPLVEELGLRQYANASSSGSTCTGDSTSQDNPQYGCSDFRINALMGANGRIPDIIIVYMGTNDLLESVPLGENDGTAVVEEGVIDNFSDAYTLMLDKLENYYSCSDIYCCTLLQVGDYGTETPYVPFTNGQGLTAEDYTKQIRMIAENKGFPVIDLYHCGIEIDNLQEMTSDGVHPTPEGMKYIADAVSGTIMSVRSR